MMDLNRFQLHIFSPQMVSQNAPVKLCDTVYKHWFSTWSKIFESKGLTDYPKKIQFLRQSYISVITYDDQIAAYMLNTIYNLDSFVCKDNPVFNNISELTFRKFKKHNIHSTLSVEYLTANPKVQKQFNTLPYGEILIGTAIQIAENIGVDSIFGTAREDFKVDMMAKTFGAERFQSNFQQYNLPCSFMVVPLATAKTHPNPFIKKFMQTLWINKNTYDRIDNQNFKHINSKPGRSDEAKRG